MSMDIKEILDKLTDKSAPVRAELADFVEKYVEDDGNQIHNGAREIAEDVTPANQATKQELRTEIKFPPLHVRGRAINNSFAKGGGGIQEKPGNQSASVNKLYNTGLSQNDRKRLGKDDKSTKVSAKYVDGPVKSEPCNSCTMFRDPDEEDLNPGPGSCTAVRGLIEPLGHCDFYKAKSSANDIAMDTQIVFDRA